MNKLNYIVLSFPAACKHVTPIAVTTAFVRGKANHSAKRLILAQGRLLLGTYAPGQHNSAYGSRAYALIPRGIADLQKCRNGTAAAGRHSVSNRHNLIIRQIV